MASEDEMNEDYEYDSGEDNEDYESDEYNNYNDDPLVDTSNAYKPIKLQRSNSFEVIDKNELVKESNKLVDEVIDVLGISHPAASTLLRHMKYVTCYDSFRKKGRLETKGTNIHASLVK
jgi:hypothetical protein